MERIVIDTAIRAPIERCFDLARDIDEHVRSAAETQERAIGSRRHGVLELGDEVTWEARHFALTMTMTVRVTAVSRPRVFEDVMISGPFRSLHHRHEFTAAGADTRMRDEFTFSAPYGLLGRVVEVLVLRPYLTRFLRRRAASLKAVAESGANT